MVEITCAIDCPECGKSPYVTFDALIGSGMVPSTKETCGYCGATLSICADLDISVYADDD